MKLNAKRVQELDDQPVVNKLEYQKTYSAVL